MGGHPARHHWEDTGLAMLLAGFFSGPVAWGLALQTNYSLVKWACAADALQVLVLVCVAALAAIAGGFALSWRCYTQLRGEGHTAGARMIDRSYFLAVAGLWLNGIFALLVVTTTASHFILSPCR